VHTGSARQLRDIHPVVDDDLRAAGTRRRNELFGDPQELRGGEVLGAKLDEPGTAGEQRFAEGDEVPSVARGSLGVEDGVEWRENGR
jgi:hypothetical protein